MKNLTFANMAEVCGGRLGNYDVRKDREVSGVVLDSRKAEENFLFVATVGERVDGHDFIPQVLKKGAAGVLCEREPENMKAPYILVKDSFQALKDIAEYYREQLPIKVIGITGSVGKTSTKEFIASVLKERYNVLKTEGNFNNEVGLPLTILRIQEEHQAAVLEMGISDFGEMHRLSKMAKPDICVLTNIGQCHLENLKSRQGILSAKSEIFDFMNPEGRVCVNGDDDMLCTIEEVGGCKPLHFGKSKRNEIYADQIVNKGLFGSTASIHLGGEDFCVDIPLPGEHMVYNAVAAAAVGSLMGLSLSQIQRGIGKVKPVGGRSNIISHKHGVLIDDCYNANPVSMCAAIDLLTAASTRKVAVLGDMFELGKNTEELHAGVGAYAVEKGIDVIICIGILAEKIYEGALSQAQRSDIGKEHIHYFQTKEAFLENCGRFLMEKDTVLVKASHGMHFENVVSELTK